MTLSYASHGPSVCSCFMVRGPWFVLLVDNILLQIVGFCKGEKAEKSLLQNWKNVTGETVRVSNEKHKQDQ